MNAARTYPVQFHLIVLPDAPLSCSSLESESWVSFGIARSSDTASSRLGVQNLRATRLANGLYVKKQDPRKMVLAQDLGYLRVQGSSFKCRSSI